MRVTANNLIWMQYVRFWIVSKKKRRVVFEIDFSYAHWLAEFEVEDVKQNLLALAVVTEQTFGENQGTNLI